MATGSEFSPAEGLPALVEWMENCLSEVEEAEDQSYEISDITDGNTISMCLHHIDPQVFTASWRTKIIPDVSGSWRLKASNLKKVNKSMQDYYSSTLNVSLEKFPLPEIQPIAEHNDPKQLARLLQLLLGIAVHCEQKEKYIQAIMGMRGEVQHTVMAAIQDLMSLEGPLTVTVEAYKELEEEHQQASDELKQLRAERESLLQLNHDLQGKVSEADSQLADLRAELEQTKERGFTQVEPGTPGGVKLQRVHRQMDSLKSEKMHIEAERDDYLMRVSEYETMVEDLQQKNKELVVENAELPVLRDTVEELRYLEGKVKNYESVISQYKKKFEDMQDLRRQMKVMEDKNMTYVQQCLDLEEELRRQSGMKQQLDTQRQRVSSLENELAKEKLKLLEASQDAEEKALITQSLNNEVKELRHQLEQQAFPSTPISAPPLSAELFSGSSSREEVDSSNSLMEAFTPALKEKMVRIEKENEILKRRLQSGSESSAAPSEEVDDLRHQFTEKSVQLEKLEKSLSKKSQELSELSEFRSNFNETQSLLKAKDAEIEKYKKYLSKAKKIIEGFGEKRTDTAVDSAEAQLLRAQLQERDRQLEKLEKAFELDRQTRDREEKLILSAWYNLGLKHHQQLSKERILSQPSFLTQQRQAVLKRPTAVYSSTLTPSSIARE